MHPHILDGILPKACHRIGHPIVLQSPLFCILKAVLLRQGKPTPTNGATDRSHPVRALTDPNLLLRSQALLPVSHGLALRVSTPELLTRLELIPLF